MNDVALALDAGVKHLALGGQVVCVHSSLGSFERLAEGADTIIDALLAAGCTILVPTFTYAFETATPTDAQWRCNGMVYRTDQVDGTDGPGFRVEDNALSRSDMGALPAAVLARPDRVRGAHPLNSFAALGPAAPALVGGQSAQDVYAPLRHLVTMAGRVILMGVDETSMTLAHLAEADAGRTLFRRWGRHDGVSVECQVGSCSAGFGQLHSAIEDIEESAVVAGSAWRVLPARATLAALTTAIRREPMLTHCGRDRCLRCRDGVAGGPVVA